MTEDSVPKVFFTLGLISRGIGYETIRERPGRASKTLPEVAR